jgi:hypothetical protein
MTPSNATRINRLLGLAAMVAGLMAIAFPGEPAARSRDREAAAAASEPSAEEAGDTQPVAQPVADSTKAEARPDSSRVGRAPFYGGSPIPLAPPKPPVKHRRPASNQTARADSTAIDSTKADSSMEGLVCFQ